MATTSVYRTIASSGSLTTWTFSCWVKRASVTSTNKILICNRNTAGSKVSKVQFNFTIEAIQFYDNNASDPQIDNKTNASYRDVGAWYHIVQVWDSTNGTPADRARLWVNGVRVTDFSAEVTPASSQESPLLEANSPSIIAIGRDPVANDSYFDGEMSHVHLIDGTAYDASTFGETDATSGIWKIKTSPSVTYGTNGFFLKMEDRTNLDLDSGTNAFTMTTGGTLTATYDNPSNNFCTMNPNNNRSLNTYSNGNNTIVGYGDGYSRAGFGTMAVSASKWYWEIKINSTIPGNTAIGICNLDGINLNSDLRFAPFGSGSLYSYGYKFNGEKITVGTSSSYGNTYTNGDYIGCAFDLDNNKIYFSKNGTWQDSGDPTSGGTGTGAAFTLQSGEDYMPSQFFDNGPTVQFNFGNGYFGTDLITSPEADDAGLGAFKYDVPAGYYAICTKNIKAYGG